MNTRDNIGRGGLEARLQALAPGLDVLGFPACILDAELRYRYVNDPYAALSSHKRADLEGRTPDEEIGRAHV